MPPLIRPLLTAALVALAVSLTARAQRDEFDVILRRGTIVDGTGHPGYIGDIAIRNGRIARVGDLTRVWATVNLDVEGLVVAPGFLNLHSHASAAALPDAVNMLTQGVTTEILNPDGGGPLDLDAQLTRLAAGGLAVNVGASIGFNSLWRDVVGVADRRPDAGEIERMRALVVAGLEAGAWGVSAGLDYQPAYLATTDEVVRVVEVARPWRTLFTNHDRVTPESGFSGRAGVEETIAIGERAGLAPVITHMKVQGREQGTAAAQVALMREATARGVFTAADVYPYLAGQTGLGALLIPAWAQDGGPEAQRKRFADPTLRARIVAEAEAALAARFGGAAGVYLPATQRELVDVMKEFQASAGETIVRLLESGAGGSAILRFGIEPDLVTLLQYPDSAIACDCGATTSTRTHPRNYGTYPRVLGRYVRETKALTMEDAIRKMTGLPATIIGMTDRGFLAPGMAADVTVFDPATVLDRATYENPAELSAGVLHVLVNGRVALRDGTPTGERAGRALRRSMHMPTRRLAMEGSRRVAIRGTVPMTPVDGARSRGSVLLAFEIAQRGGGRTATGSFRLEDRDTRLVLEMTDPGLLQVAPGWATFSGWARSSRGAGAVGLTVIVDEGGLSPDRRGPTVVIEAGDYRVRGTLPVGVLRTMSGQIP